MVVSTDMVEYMDYLIDQVFKASTVSPVNRPMEIYVQTNFSDSNLTETEMNYAIKQLKYVIKHDFTILSPTLILSRPLVVFPILYSIIILLGLVTNALMIFAFYRAEKLRTFRNVFIINLAISDILLCLICAPLTLLKYIEINWHLGRVLCKLGPGLQTTIVMVTAFSIATIAIDRWQFITGTGKDLSTKLGTFVCILVIWTLGFIVSIPSFTVNDLKIVKLAESNEILYTVCTEMWLTDTFKYTFSIVTFIFQYMLPLIIVTTSNCKICIALNKLPSIKSYRFRIQKNNLSEPSTHIIKFKAKSESTLIGRNNKNSTIPLKCDPPKQINEESASLVNETSVNPSDPLNSLVVRYHERFLRSRQLLKVVCFSFAFCWLPLLIFNLMLDFFETTQFKHNSLPSLFLMSHLIATSSCIINPIIYGFFNTNFKEEMFKIICCCKSTDSSIS